ncbi:hypothetical protein V8E36_007544 [Tilletia maclaganii]
MAQPADDAPAPLAHVQDLLRYADFEHGGRVLGARLIQVVQLHLEQHDAHIAANIQLAIGGGDRPIEFLAPLVDETAVPNQDVVEQGEAATIEDDASPSAAELETDASSPSPTPPRPPPTLVHEAVEKIISELERVGATDHIQHLLARLPSSLTEVLQDAILRRPDLPFAIAAPAIDLLTRVPAGRPSATGLDDEIASMDLDGDGHEGPHDSRSAERGRKAEVRASMLDDWVLDNERIMRARLVLDDPALRPAVDQAIADLHGPEAAAATPSSQSEADGPSTDESQRSTVVDRKSSHWEQYLVALGRDGRHPFTPPKGTETAELVQETTSSWQIHRPKSEEMPGTTILDTYRSGIAHVNKIDEYLRTFDRMTANVFRGLDWNNIFVAGGIALGALTSDGSEESERGFKRSDVDIFMVGLSPDKCLAKVKHIEQVIAANLPPREDGSSYAVVRTASTITFCPADPAYRRIQVVLRVFPNPMSVLLDFDLDQVTVGRAGDEVYMLPRCARSIITGYTVFTMDLVQGSWLTPRSATYPSRIYKYSYRGYGVRFLASYLAALPTVPLSEATTDDASVWEGSLPRDELSVTLREERLRMRWWIAQQQQRALDRDEPPITFATVKERLLETFGDKHGNSLSPGWQHFCRQIALMELRHVPGLFADVDVPSSITSVRAPEGGATDEGVEEEENEDQSEADDTETLPEVGIEVEPTAGTGPIAAIPPVGLWPPPALKPGLELVTYDNTPLIKWQPGFGLAKLKEAVERANDADLDNLITCTERWFSRYSGQRPDFMETMKEVCQKELPLQRAIYGESVEEALKQPLISLVHMPKNFRAVAESHLPAAHFRFVNVLKPKYEPVHGTNTLEELEQSAAAEGSTYTRDPERASFPLHGELSTARADPKYVLVYCIQDGVNQFPSPWGTDATGLFPLAEPQPKLYWQLSSRVEDEICDIIRALQRTQLRFSIPPVYRNLALRKYLLSWVERPTKADELKEFTTWVCKKVKPTLSSRRDNVNNIIFVKRAAVFRRFAMTLPEMALFEMEDEIPRFRNPVGEMRLEQLRLWFQRRLRINGVEI